jgi:hypothetical protein
MSRRTVTFDGNCDDARAIPSGNGSRWLNDAVFAQSV